MFDNCTLKVLFIFKLLVKLIFLMYNEYRTITYKVSFKQLSELSIKLAVIILTTEN